MLKPSQPRLNQLASAIAIVLGGASFMSVAHAAAPTAGVNISNIASASYTDAGGKNQNVTSNEVKTTVLQVASFTLVADRSTTSNPNGQVSLSHTLTNTGNGTDSFKIDIANVAAGDDFDFAAPKVYLDANGDGVPDNTTNLNGTNISLPAGGSTGLIVVATTPNSSTNAQTGQLTITATSTFDIAAGTPLPVTNTDTVTVTGNAVVKVTKSASVATAAAGSQVEYTLTYSNIGNTAATDVAVTDVLPANVTYVPTSGIANGVGLTDGAGDDAFTYDAATRTVTFTAATLAANTTGSVKFTVTVDSAAPAGAINNTANFVYDPDGAGTTPITTPEPTNTSTVTVAATYVGSINDSSTDNYADAAKDPADTAKDDLIEVATVNQGSTATFETYVWNNGNVAEAFNLTVNKAALPAGATVSLFKADGVTPLTSTNADTIPDTGPIAVGASQKIVVKVTLPNTFGGVAGPDNLDTIITSTPVDGGVVDTVTLRIVDVVAATVDLTNGNGGGTGPYDPATPVDAATTEAGQPYSFPVAVTNNGTSPDNFNLSATVPPGWTVTFYEADDTTGVCSSTVVTNSGSIAAGATNKLCAVVTPPANELPGTSDVVITAASPATGLTDSMKDTLTVDENRNLIFTADQTGQVAPGGTVVYTHTLTNTGNVTEGDDAGELLVNVSLPQNGFNTTLYVDLNNDGIADPNELVAVDPTTGNADLQSVLAGSNGGAGLQPGEVVKVLVKVEAPAGATAGQQEVTTVTLTPTGTVNGEAAPAPLAVTDTSTVTDGQIRLVKTQALDADCSGAEDGAGFSSNTISAKPGACVIYRIVATNEGNAPVTNVVINDAVPAFTTLFNNPAVSNDTTTGTVSSTATSVTNTVGTMGATTTANLLFSVKIDQ
jgi:trimeric autotransporter adhesin